MFRVTLPSNVVYVTPEQLPRFLANVAETRYTSSRGELLQTTSIHSLVTDMTTVTLLSPQTGALAIQERDSFKERWQEAATRVRELEDELRDKEQELDVTIDQRDALSKSILRAKKKVAKLKRK